MSAHFDVPTIPTEANAPTGLGLLMRAMEDAMGPRNNSPYQPHIIDGKAMRPSNKIVEVVAAAPAAVVAATKHIMPPAATLSDMPAFRTRRVA